MIKFFRKIRHRFLSENKFSKYLLYAIGEIILVVIGILIALQINNWNQDRLQDQVLININRIIVEDLKNDIADIDLILRTKREKEVYFTKILKGEMTREDYKQCRECKFLIVGSLDLSIEKRGYNLLNNVSTSKMSIDSLSVKIVQFYTKQLVELTVDNPLRENDIENNINHWKENYTWYAAFITQQNSDSFIEYALNDPDYTNRVANYYLLNYTIYIPLLETFTTEAKSIVNELELALEE
ncbi:DUF6090 family protein [Altibacter lentus]|uniref:DUF6090 family protein n=1 Tax=Altibacter lentus TaxID=1223410 RepID=UPI00068A0B75|nr:DUF6090 family protein [Altibacter lentus]